MTFQRGGATVIVAILALAAGGAAAGPETQPTLRASLPDGTRIEFERGAAPVLSLLPRPGEGWLQIARRVAGSDDAAGPLRSANPSLAQPLRGLRVRVPWAVIDGDLRLEVLKALFPRDSRSREGWTHVVTAPWGGEPENWWEIAELWTGDGRRYRELRAVNRTQPLFPRRGARILIPHALLNAGPLLDGGPAVSATTGSSQTISPRPTPTAAPATTVAGALPVATEGGSSPLEYRDSEAIYRLKPGEALYSSVVVRFTGQLHAVDVNATAADIAKRSGIRDVTDIPIGFPVRIPFEMLLPEFLPPGNPRRVEWEKSQAELAAIRRVIRSANLDGIHVILDAGHGGSDTGAVAAGIWESTYVYDVMTRLKRVLERDTRATVWALVRDTAYGWSPPDEDVLPQERSQQLLVDPPYDLAESTVGVHLRWVLTNSILARLRRQHVDPERVVFVSIHADSLHPSVRGLMVYAPDRSLRPGRVTIPGGLFPCREVNNARTVSLSRGFRARAEALSTQLGRAVVAKAEQFHVPVHAFEPVRSSVLRRHSRWVPAVLKNSEVPTSVLVEICNLNNEDDRKLLLTWQFREKLAHAIAAGLAEAFSR